MKVKKMNLQSFNAETGAWSGDIPTIITKLGFRVRSSTPGRRHNCTDGEYDYNFVVNLMYKLYTIHVNSNIWCNEKEKLHHVLESSIQEI